MILSRSISFSSMVPYSLNVAKINYSLGSRNFAIDFFFRVGLSPYKSRACQKRNKNRLQKRLS